MLSVFMALNFGVKCVLHVWGSAGEDCRCADAVSVAFLRVVSAQ